MRKAFVVGVNNYTRAPLKGPENDAKAVGEILEYHGNGQRNFEVMIHTRSVTTDSLLKSLHKLFEQEADAALFYFSGHGADTRLGTYLVTPDRESTASPGVSMSDLLTIANNSPATNRVIILDCCNAGAAGIAPFTGGVVSSLHNGITILASSKPRQPSVETNGRGLFTSLLLDALDGGAADLSGSITPGSIYSHIDKSLGAWDQRPVFKTNISHFVSLRDINPTVPAAILRKLPTYFPAANSEMPLDPSFEFTNHPKTSHKLVKPYAKQKNVAIFKELQKLRDAGLVTPVGAAHMYFAAMRKKSCKLTPLGRHYWHLSSENKL